MGSHSYHAPMIQGFIMMILSMHALMYLTCHPVLTDAGHAPDRRRFNPVMLTATTKPSMYGMQGIRAARRAKNRAGPYSIAWYRDY